MPLYYQVIRQSALKTIVNYIQIIIKDNELGLCDEDYDDYDDYDDYNNDNNDNNDKLFPVRACFDFGQSSGHPLLFLLGLV